MTARPANITGRYRRCWTSALLLFALVLLAPALSARAQDAESIFNRAVEAYRLEQYDSAASGFQQLVKAGVDDPRVWHNLGNCYFKLGHVGHALIAYKRGLRIAPRDADLQANFRFVRLYAADKIEPVGEVFVERWWRALVAYLSLAETRWLAGICFWLAALVTVWLMWPGRSRTRLAAPLTIVWGLWLLTTGAAATAYVRDVTSRTGAVVVDQTRVRSGPGESYPEQFDLPIHDGLMGTVERHESGWYLVRFPNGLKGWVAATDFEII